MRSARCVTVLCYHSVDDSDSLVSVTPEQFEEQMRYIRDTGYNVVSLQDAFHNRPDDSPDEENHLVITFDDGYKNTYTKVAPILKKYGLKATVFLTTDYMDSKAKWLERDFDGVFNSADMREGTDEYLNQCREIFRKRIPYFAELPTDEFSHFIEKFRRITELEMLTWDEARCLDEYGFSYGAHTCKHPFLTMLSDEQKQEEISVSKSVLEEKLGKDVDYFCYPYGDYDPYVENCVKMAGYRGACTTDPGINRLSEFNPFALHRVSIGADCSHWKFKFYLSPWYRFYLQIKGRQ